MEERDITQILQALARINEKLDSIIKQGDDHEQRLRTLEAAGGKKWESATGTVITALIMGIAGYFIGKIL